MKPYAKAIVAVASLCANVVVVALALQTDFDAAQIISLLTAVNAAGVAGVFAIKNEKA